MDTLFASAVDATADTADGRMLPGAPRPVRHLEPPEAPWPGFLATDADESVQLVDLEVLRGWAGWDSAGDGHVLGPLDVVRRADGHDAVLPLCTQRLARVLQRRAGRGAPLSCGEAVTVVVSVMRGTAEVLTRGPFAAGEWWLTDAGKPVFVHGEGPDALSAADLCLAALGEVLPEVADLRARLGTAQMVDAADADLAHPRVLATALPEIEATLFARGAPEPLATTDLAPVRARSVVAVPGGPDDVLALAHRRGWRPLAGIIDGDLRDVVAAGWDALTETRHRRARARTEVHVGKRPRRGRILLLAGAAGAAVVAVGLMWPTKDPVNAQAEPSASASSSSPRPAGAASATRASAPATSASSPRRSATPTSRASAAPSRSADVASGSEIAAVVQAMLSARIACGTDDACRSSFAEDAQRHLPAGAIDESAQDVSLLDDFGGAAVVRVTAARVTGDGRTQLVVVVRSNGKWLIRDVSDVADQP